MQILTKLFNSATTPTPEVVGCDEQGNVITARPSIAVGKLLGLGQPIQGQARTYEPHPGSLPPQGIAQALEIAGIDLVRDKRRRKALAEKHAKWRELQSELERCGGGTAKRNFRQQEAKRQEAIRQNPALAATIELQSLEHYEAGAINTRRAIRNVIKTEVFEPLEPPYREMAGEANGGLRTAYSILSDAERKQAALFGIPFEEGPLLKMLRHAVQDGDRRFLSNLRIPPVEFLRQFGIDVEKL